MTIICAYCESLIEKRSKWARIFPPNSESVKDVCDECLAKMEEVVIKKTPPVELLEWTVFFNAQPVSVRAPAEAKMTYDQLVMVAPFALKSGSRFYIDGTEMRPGDKFNLGPEPLHIKVYQPEDREPRAKVQR